MDGLNLSIQKKGAGTILPIQGGQPLHFGKADLQEPTQTPKIDERFSYEAGKGKENAPQAFKMKKQSSKNQSLKEQARKLTKGFVGFMGLDRH